VPEGRPAWKDNAYLAFWDPSSEVFGAAHVSTSPNAEGRRARFSISINGRAVEIVEDLAPGTFESDSISFGLDDAIRVRTSELTGTLTNNPIFAVADYSQHSVIPPLPGCEPLQHFQRAAAVRGDFVLANGEQVGFEGHGFRDRTWGYRDESSSITEYIAFMVVFPDHSLTAMRFHGTDGSDRTEGYRLDTAGQAKPVTGIEITRDASGLLHSARLTSSDGDITLAAEPRMGGFWVPMGWVRHGPTMSAYDEFLPVVTQAGQRGFAMVEHGNIRNLF
jgi:hypothetical protein